MYFSCCASLLGQEENLFAKKNYEKYLAALKDSGLVYMEDKGQGTSSDVAVGAEGGAGAMVLLGRRNSKHSNVFLFQLSIASLACVKRIINSLCCYMEKLFTVHFLRNDGSRKP